MVSLASCHDPSGQNPQNTGDCAVSDPLFPLVELGDDVLEVHAAPPLSLSKFLAGPTPSTATVDRLSAKQGHDCRVDQLYL